jgi:hypothetical protein
MLKPTKHMNPQTSVLGVSGYVLDALQEHRIISYNDLDRTLKTQREDATYNLPATLQLLYLLGIIEYHLKTDSIEYLRT